MALASTALQGDILVCESVFTDAGGSGSVRLVVGEDYASRSLTVSRSEPDGWSRAEIVLDPTERHLPGPLSHAFFAVRFTRAPPPAID